MSTDSHLPGVGTGPDATETRGSKQFKIIPPARRSQVERKLPHSCFPPASDYMVFPEPFRNSERGHVSTEVRKRLGIPVTPLERCDRHLVASFAAHHEVPSVRPVLDSQGWQQRPVVCVVEDHAVDSPRRAASRSAPRTRRHFLQDVIGQSSSWSKVKGCPCRLSSRRAPDRRRRDVPVRDRLPSILIARDEARRSLEHAFPQLFLVQIEGQRTEIILVFGPRRVNLSGDDVDSVDKPQLRASQPSLTSWRVRQSKFGSTTTFSIARARVAGSIVGRASRFQRAGTGSALCRA